MGSQYYTLSDVYRAAREETHFDYCFWLQVTLGICMEFCFLCVGRLLVILASLLITSISASGFVIVLPAVATPWTLWFNFNIIWGKLQLPLKDTYTIESIPCDRRWDWLYKVSSVIFVMLIVPL